MAFNPVVYIELKKKIWHENKGGVSLPKCIVIIVASCSFSN